jgi:hypothetical protein
MTYTKQQIRGAMIEELNAKLSRVNHNLFLSELEILSIIDSALSRLPDLPDEKPSGEYDVPVSVEERLPEESGIFTCIAPEIDGMFSATFDAEKKVFIRGMIILRGELKCTHWLEKRTFLANVPDEEIKDLDFIAWYSGMAKEKIIAAHKRYLDEVAVIKNPVNVLHNVVPVERIPDVGAVTDEDIDNEAELRYPVKRHSVPSDSPYERSFYAFIYGAKWMLNKLTNKP